MFLVLGLRLGMVVYSLSLQVSSLWFGVMLCFRFACSASLVALRLVLFWGLLLIRHTSASGHHTDAPIGSWPFVKSSQRERERERERERKGGRLRDTSETANLSSVCVLLLLLCEADKTA